MDVGLLAAQVFNGLVYSSILFLVSSGLTLIYGIMNVLNLAHGSLYMLGAYLGITIVVYALGGTPLAYLVAFLLVPPMVGLVGALLERTLIRRTYPMGEEYQLLLTFGLILVFDDLVKMVWGAAYINFPDPNSFLGGLRFGVYTLPLYHVILIVLGFAVFLGLWTFFSRTFTGKVMRAAAMDREIVEAMGVDVNRVFVSSFFLGSLLSGLGGISAGPLYTASPGMGTDIIVYSFAVIVIGGMGSIGGAMAGSLIVGVLRSLAISFYPQLEIVIVFVIMAAVLLMKPTGLFGRPEFERR